MEMAKNLAIAGSVLILALLARHFFPSLRDDNPVEQVAEMIIKEETGVSVDLSPEDDNVKK